MAKTIGNVKSTISSRLHGTTLNKLGDFNLLCRDAAEIMINRIDLQETRRRALLPNAIYDSVYDYSLPADFKAPISLNPQANNRFNGNQTRTFSKQFYNQKKDNQFAIVWEDMVQYLRFSKYLRKPITIDKADSLTENGDWVVTGNGTNLEVDTYNYISGTGSLKCDVSSPGAVVNVIMKLGSDSSNYFSKTITTGHFEAFQTGWNLCRFDLASSTETGTVNTAEIAYVQFTVTYNTNQTVIYTKTLTASVDMSVDNYISDGAIFAYLDFASVSSLSVLRLDNITAHIGTLYDVNYYSNYVFRTSAGTWIEQPTSDSDLVNLSSLSYKIFEAELCKMITQQIQGSMGGFDFTYWNLQLEGDGRNQLGLYEQYGNQYPSEREESQTDYYTFSSDPLGVYDEARNGADGMPGDENITYENGGFYVEE
jgi:hypothetical protein